MQRLDALKNLNSKFEQNLFEGNENIADFKSKKFLQIITNLKGVVRFHPKLVKSIESCPFFFKKTFRQHSHLSSEILTPAGYCRVGTCAHGLCIESGQLPL